MPEDAAIRQPGFRAHGWPPASPSPRLPRSPGTLGSLSSCRWLAWPSPVDRAVHACSDALRAGWLARQAIVSEGREVGRA